MAKITQAGFLAQLAALFGLDLEQASSPPVEYPAMVLHKGVTFLLHAPLADDYLPSDNARRHGSLPGMFVQDPSNGVGKTTPSGEPAPVRSAGGYPLNYGIMPGPDGRDQIAWHVPPRLMHGDDTFADEAELASWRERMARYRPADPR